MSAHRMRYPHNGKWIYAIGPRLLLSNAMMMDLTLASKRFAARTAATMALAVSTALLTSSEAAAQTPPVQGPEGLKAVGPVDQINGYPMWYEDKHGIKLGLCTNGAHCFFLPPNPGIAARAPTSPTDTTHNWPDESFFYAAETGFDGINGTRGLLIHALEASYLGGEVKRDDEIVWVRFRLHFWNLQPFQDYTFKYPFGQETHQADGDGRIFVTRDIGIGNPGEFKGALQGELGPFLLPVGVVDENGQPRADMLQPGMYLTQGLQETRVVGSPTGFNAFSMEGPGIDQMFPDLVDLTDARTDYVVTDMFTVQGMIANRHGVEHEKSYYTRTADMTSIDVFANSSPAQDLFVQLPNGLRIRMDERAGGPGVYHAKIDLGQGAAVPASVTLVNALDTPPSTKLVQGFSPLVTLTHADYSTSGSLIVQARTTDQLSTAPIPLKGLGLPAGTQLDWINNGAFAATLPITGAPPSTLSIGANTMRHSTKVVVRGSNDAGVPHPAIADAGPDQFVTTGDTVTLSGVNSQAANLTYAWSQLTGLPVTLTVDATNPAIVTFVAPPVPPGGDEGTTVLSFRLVVNGISGDTVLVTVRDPAAIPPDDIRIERALYDVTRRQWRIFGRTNLAENQRVHIYIGTVDEAADPATWDRTRPIATVFSDGGGLWNYEPGRLTATGTAIPLPTDTFIWAESELRPLRGGAPGILDFRRR